MQYFYKVFLYENGVRTTEYTKNLQTPIFIEDRLDERLDSGQIVLDGIAREKAFEPKTKFIIEMFTGRAESGDAPYKYWHFIVDHDDVETYLGISGKYCHRITLIEPSAIAQGKHPDNISLTYALNDVNLNYRTVTSSDEPTYIKEQRIPSIGGRYYRGPRTTDYYSTLDTSLVIGGSGGTWRQTSRTYENNVTPYTTLFHNTQTLYVDNSFRYMFEDANNFASQIRYKSGLNAQQWTFQVPRIRCEALLPNGWEFLFYIPTITRVYREIWRKNTDGSVSFQSRDATPVATLNYNPTGIASTKKEVFYNEGGRVGFYRNRTASGTSSSSTPNPSMQQGHSNTLTRFNSGDWEKCPAIIDTTITNQTSRTISFSTPIYTQSDLNQYEYRYVVETVANPLQANSMVSHISMWDRHSNYRRGTMQYFLGFIPTGYSDSKVDWSTGNSITQIDTTPIISVECIIKDLTSPVVGKAFLTRGAKYNCYDLFRKAMLSCDTYVIDNNEVGLDEYTLDSNHNIVGSPSIDYPIVVHGGSGEKSSEDGEDWILRMKNTTVNETIFEQKNLWEILLQIGYYMHAIPYLEFLEDGTDRLLLKFRQLGGTKEQDDGSAKLSIFNSRPMQDYFASYDTYLTNLYSPQNEVRETVVAKTSDQSTQLITADSAEIQVTNGITELFLFNIKYNGQTRNALEYVFEKSIYDIISNNDPNYVIPSKGCSLWFQLGDNKIQGLNYVAPQVNNGDNLTALKYIVQRLFGGNQANLNVNSLIFEIGYRTQSSSRYTQFRPDLDKYMKNSRLEKYPHHEQFFGQQEKIVDSERMAQNLWGRLLRGGNGVYQYEEYAINGSEKESGDLVRLNDNEIYYVTEVENELYDNALLQKVTYSKHFNQISQIVTIPSEPRFYEVSERSKINRTVRMQDFFKLSGSPGTPGSPKYLRANIWQDYIAALIFNATKVFPNYVAMTFKADKKRIHRDSRNNTISINDMFPSSEVVVTSNNTIQPAASKSYAICCVPCEKHFVKNGILFSWKMEDNFKAGDYVDAPYNTQTGVKEGAYTSMYAARYCDIKGRADLFSFVMWYNASWYDGEVPTIQKFFENFNFNRNPNNLVVASQADGKDIALDKDNREAIACSLQFNLLHDDEFVIFANIFGNKDNNLSVALCTRKINLFDDKIDFNAVLNIALTRNIVNDGTGRIRIDFSLPSGVSLNDIVGYNEENEPITLGDTVKSIIFYDNSNSGRVLYLARNLERLLPQNRLSSWFIYPHYND